MSACCRIICEGDNIVDLIARTNEGLGAYLHFESLFIKSPVRYIKSLENHHGSALLNNNINIMAVLEQQVVETLKQANIEIFTPDIDGYEALIERWSEAAAKRAVHLITSSLRS